MKINWAQSSENNMSREALIREISSLERKVTLLLAEHDKVKEQLNHKEQENVKLRGTINAYQSELSSFQNRYNVSKLVGNSVTGKEEAEALRKMLDTYIQEIDKCIAHLGEA
jgi:predicted  nucleic acid-binding Zn-ribbon protein